MVLKKRGLNSASSKLLYSFENKDFYVVLKNENNHTEYYVSLDGNDVRKIRSLKTKKKDQKLLSDAFNFANYHTNFITNIPDAKYIWGKDSYFVVKDSTGKRYGEYSLAALTLPLSIDGALAGYIIRKLGEEIPQYNAFGAIWFNRRNFYSV